LWIIPLTLSLPQNTTYNRIFSILAVIFIYFYGMLLKLWIHTLTYKMAKMVCLMLPRLSQWRQAWTF